MNTRSGTQLPPSSSRLPTLLTIILLGHWVLDEGGELVKDVVASGRGLPVAGRQAGESGVKKELVSDPRAAGTIAPFLGSVLGGPPWGPLLLCPGPHSGGPSVSSRNSSICSVSVLASPSYSKMGSCEPGAKSFSTSGDLWAQGMGSG